MTTLPRSGQSNGGKPAAGTGRTGGIGRTRSVLLVLPVPPVLHFAAEIGRWFARVIRKVLSWFTKGRGGGGKIGAFKNAAKPHEMRSYRPEVPRSGTKCPRKGPKNPVFNPRKRQRLVQRATSAANIRSTDTSFGPFSGHFAAVFTPHLGYARQSPWRNNQIAMANRFLHHGEFCSAPWRIAFCTMAN